MKNELLNSCAAGSKKAAKCLFKILFLAIGLLWISNAFAQFSSGSGSPADPYVITTADELNEVRNYLSSSFILDNNIDLSSFANWDPIGTEASPFTGEFDGNGKVITELKINRPSVPNNVGLFGATNGATLENIGVEVAASGVTGGGGGGGSYVDAGVGGLVGYAKASDITGCYVTGGFVKGIGDEVGGLVGYVVGSVITECFAAVDVIGGTTGATYGFVGGLIGGIEDGGTNKVIKCFATGDVTGTEYLGGLIGTGLVRIPGDVIIIENCYATGNVKSTGLTSSEFLHTGGFIGTLMGADGDVTINQCFSSGNVVIANLGSVGGAAGGFIGQASKHISISNCYAFGNISAPSGTGNVGGFVGQSNGVTGTYQDCYADNTVSGGSGSGSLTGSFAGKSNHGSTQFDGCVVNNSTLDIIGNVPSVLSSEIEEMPSAQMPKQDIFVAWDPSAWDIIGGQAFLKMPAGLAPVITSVATYTCVDGIGGSFAPTATGAIPIVWKVSGAPSGVTTSGGTLNVSTSVSAGTYNFILIASNATLNEDTQTFTLIVTPTAPYISGTKFMTLTLGYEATSTEAYDISGSRPVTVTKVSGNDKITWNNATKKLDIAAGLPVGNYEVELRASNNTTKLYTFIFTLTVVDNVFFIDNPEQFTGGTVASDPRYLAKEDETVTLTITPEEGYVLESIIVCLKDNGKKVELSGSGLTRTFKMPAAHVDVEAVFKTGTQGIGEIAPAALYAFSQNGILYLNGLTPGASWSVYNITGSLIAQGIATDVKAEIALSGRGLYIVRSGNKAVKVSN